MGEVPAMHVLLADDVTSLQHVQLQRKLVRLTDLQQVDLVLQ